MSDPNFDRAVTRIVRGFAALLDNFAIVCVDIAPKASAILMKAARELREAYPDPGDKPS